MPRYQMMARCFVDGVLREVGEKIIHPGPPGKSWLALDPPEPEELLPKSPPLKDALPPPKKAVVPPPNVDPKTEDPPPTLAVKLHAVPEEEVPPSAKKGKPPAPVRADLPPSPEETTTPTEG